MIGAKNIHFVIAEMEGAGPEKLDNLGTRPFPGLKILPGGDYDFVPEIDENPFRPLFPS
jgi:hypothetical protein